MSATAARLLSPEEIAVRAGGDIPFLRFADRSTAFGEREMRLRQLAAGHSMRDYLLFVADLARAQGEVLATLCIDVTLPDSAQIEQAGRAGTPLLPATTWSRDPRWTGLLRDVMDRLDAKLADSPARVAVRGLAARDDAYLDQQADRLLSGVMLGLDLGTAPLIAAGLQVYFAHLVIATAATGDSKRMAPFGRIDDETRCPCCGSAPTASITRIGAAEAGLSLSCLLALQHAVAHGPHQVQPLLSTKGITYQSLRTLDGEDDSGDGQILRARRPAHARSRSSVAPSAATTSKSSTWNATRTWSRSPTISPRSRSTCSPARPASCATAST